MRGHYLTLRSKFHCVIMNGKSLIDRAFSMLPPWLARDFIP